MDQNNIVAAFDNDADPRNDPAGLTRNDVPGKQAVMERGVQ